MLRTSWQTLVGCVGLSLAIGCAAPTRHQLAQHPATAAEPPRVVRAQGEPIPTLDPRRSRHAPPALPNGYQPIPAYVPPGSYAVPPTAVPPATAPTATPPGVYTPPTYAPPQGVVAPPPSAAPPPPPTGQPQFHPYPQPQYQPFPQPPQGAIGTPRPAAPPIAPPPAAPPIGAPGPVPQVAPDGAILPADPLSPLADGALVEPEDRLLDIIAEVEEAPTGRLMLGVGVNSEAGVVGSFVLDEQNFDWQRFPRSWEDIRNATAWRGAGQQFRFEAVPGSRVQRYMLSFREPFLLDTRISLGLSGFFFDRRYEDWDEQRLGGRITFGYQLRHDLTASLSLRAENVNVRNPAVPTPDDLAEVLGDNDVYSAKALLAYDTRDSAFLPTEGHLIELAYEQVFGEFDFPRFTADYRRYFLINQRIDGSGRQTLSFRGRVGLSGSQTPVFERFFAGGFSTLRGFEFRGASPREGRVEIGGRLMLLTSVEYMIPLTADDMLRAVVFVDAGTVEEDIEIHSDNFRVAPGFGLRVTVPAMGPAPLAFDFAFPVAKAPGDDEQIFSFSVGFTN